MIFKNSFLLFLLVSCSTATYTHTSDRKFPKKDSSCNFKVLSNLPHDAKYEEIGVVNVDPGMSNGVMTGPKNPVDFKNKIKSDVCEAGGDLVIGDVNGAGIYIRGTVFKKLN